MYIYIHTCLYVYVYVYTDYIYIYIHLICLYVYNYDIHIRAPFHPALVHWGHRPLSWHTAFCGTPASRQHDSDWMSGMSGATVNIQVDIDVWCFMGKSSKKECLMSVYESWAWIDMNWYELSRSMIFHDFPVLSRSFHSCHRCRDMPHQQRPNGFPSHPQESESTTCHDPKDSACLQRDASDSLEEGHFCAISMEKLMFWNIFPMGWELQVLRPSLCWPLEFSLDGQSWKGGTGGPKQTHWLYRL